MSTGTSALPSPPRSSQDGCPGSSTPSSPLRPSKRRAKPTVTPRSFRRFFTPRHATRRNSGSAEAREALVDITADASNFGQVRTPATETRFKVRVFDEDEDPCHGSNAFNHSTHGCLSPDTSPDRQPPRLDFKSLKRKRGSYAVKLEPGSGEKEAAHYAAPHMKESIHVLRSHYRGELGTMSMREFGLVSDPCHRLHGHVGRQWQSQSAAFVSEADDMHPCHNMTSETSSLTLPFCSTSCHTNPLVAVGDEDGIVRLLDTENNTKASFRTPILSFQPHQNAILDLDFSLDDSYLATASGDQSSRIIDMQTQQSVYQLQGHYSSIKQVRFQPGSGHNVIATSGRDGSVRIWDLRCKSGNSHQAQLTVQLGGGEQNAPEGSHSNTALKLGTCVGAIPQAHQHSLIPDVYGNRTSRSTIHGASQNSRRAATAQRLEVSVTAVSFLSASVSHLLLTGSEANAIVKVWDLRAKQPSGGRRWLPLGFTRQPEAHGQHRKFGLTSLSLSGDSSRLYTLCKDHSVYVYSVQHLILGTAPELTQSSEQQRRREPQQGLGPLYALRHPKLKASSFYIKSAIRPASADKTELLAVGSTEACAVLFPTSERDLKPTSCGERSPSMVSTSTASLEYGVSNSASSRNRSARETKEAPVSQRGTALIRGHEKETTALTWTSEGNLVTVGDDLKCRVWREKAERARELRIGGEAEGARWLCGWADIHAEDPHWDEDD